MTVFARVVFIGLVLLVSSIGAHAQKNVVVIPMGVNGQLIGTEIKTLPFIASQPGFYYLIRNLSTSTTGITITANDVTIDMLGYRITGRGKSANTADIGIDIGTAKNAEIRNGTVTRFPGSGISGSSGSEAARILNMRVNHNGGIGIYLSGHGNQVIGCTVSNNTSIGISPGNSGLIINNVSYDNGSHGFYVARSLVKNNHAYGNGGLNIAPIIADNVITDNYAP